MSNCFVIAVGSRWRVVRGYAQGRTAIVIEGGNENFVRYRFEDNGRSTCRNRPTFLADMEPVISPLATVIADRGKRRRSPRPTVIVLHQTGSGLVERARRAGADPKEFAVAHYSQAVAYPNYLVAPDGSVWAFADEEERTAHARWTPEERMVYRDWRGARAGGPKTGPFGWWRRRWASTASSPLTLLRASGGTTPNLSGVGIEILNHRPMSDAAYTSLARLCLDIGLRWGIDLGVGRVLPSPMLLGHADLCPLTRTARGRPYDPDLVLDWAELEVAIGRESSMTWRKWA